MHQFDVDIFDTFIDLGTLWPQSILCRTMLFTVNPQLYAISMNDNRDGKRMARRERERDNAHNNSCYLVEHHCYNVAYSVSSSAFRHAYTHAQAHTSTSQVNELRHYSLPLPFTVYVIAMTS